MSTTSPVTSFEAAASALPCSCSCAMARGEKAKAVMKLAATATFKTVGLFGVELNIERMSALRSRWSINCLHVERYASPARTETSLDVSEKRSIDSFAPAHSAFGLPVYVARVPAAPFLDSARNDKEAPGD